ncbi:ComEA family DNA-binding protein [Herbidospora daliensis]|uniref:ComEA family DNA-binding protein n=1 Tax=Herbidospora daliensis TaxID=295585 RepID=UPI0007816709|nr:hypothetical protein [Herbidospora daliensis]
MDQVPRSAARGLLWAVAPLVTFGFATPFTFGWAGLRRRSRWLVLSGALYAASMAAWLLIGNVTGTPSGIWAVVMVLGLFVSWLGGTLHAFAVRRKVFGPACPFERARLLRREARALATKNPGRARRLGVGRPDLGRRFDDGGLVDMNHAPAIVLRTVPGMTPDLVERVLEARSRTVTFTSAEDLSDLLNLPVANRDELSEYGVYLP